MDKKIIFNYNKIIVKINNTPEVHSLNVLFVINRWRTYNFLMKNILHLIYKNLYITLKKDFVMNAK